MANNELNGWEKALAWLFALVIGIPFSFVTGWAFMLGVGAVHGWIHAVPTVGYWTSVLITYAIGVVKR